MKNRNDESLIVEKNLPFIQALLKNDKISTKEKLRIMEDPSIDLKKYLNDLEKVM